MGSKRIVFDIPRIFTGLEKDNQDIAVETAPLDARQDLAILARALTTVANNHYCTPKTYVIAAKETAFFKAKIDAWLCASNIKVKAMNWDGIRFPNDNILYLLDERQQRQTNIPFKQIDRLAVIGADGIDPTSWRRLRSMTIEYAIACGNFSKRDHWFYQFAQSASIRIRLAAADIVSAFPDQSSRLIDLREIYSGDRGRRVLDLEDTDDSRMILPSYLGWVRNCLPSYCNLEFSKMHRDLEIVFSDLSVDRKRKDAIIGPRDSAKSTHGAEGYPLYCICHSTEKYILIIADTLDQAIKHVAVLKENLENNEFIAKFHPDVAGVGIEWNQTAIETRNGIRVEALGAGKGIRGRRFKESRPTLVIVDDPESDKAAHSETIRSHRREWFTKAVAKCGSPETNYLVIGSMIHQECLLAHLKNTNIWKLHEYKSIIQWPDRMDLWNQWELILRDGSRKDPEKDAKAFYESNKVEMETGAVVLWPERENLYTLMLMRATDGHPAFESEKQNNPIDPSKCEWTPDLFPGMVTKGDDWRWYDKLPEKIIARTCAIDPSKGRQDKQGDWQFRVFIAMDSKRHLYIDAECTRVPLTKMVRDTVFFAERNEVQVAGCESEQFQELIIPELQRIAIKHSISVPFLPIETNGVPKELRIRRWNTWINRQRVHWKRGSPGVFELIRQFCSFPNGEHDDGPDAAEMALRLLLQIVNKGRREEVNSPM